jgi:hypothetical protein
VRSKKVDFRKELSEGNVSDEKSTLVYGPGKAVLGRESPEQCPPI